MSTSDHDHNPDTDTDLTHIHPVLEAILLSPVTGRAVARTLESQATERKARAVVPDIRDCRSESARQNAAEGRDGASQGNGPTSPWARSH